MNSTFDDGMTLADITPVPKEELCTCKELLRPISVFPAGSNVFERILHEQISTYIDTYLSPYLCGYRKGYCVQHAILALLEN